MTRTPLTKSPRVARRDTAPPSMKVQRQWNPMSLLQRKCACGGDAGMGGGCPECAKKRLQRKGTGDIGGLQTPAIVHDVLRGPGAPLDAATRSFFEPRFDHDFGQVRVHADARAAESARAVNAQAYTVGSDIVFGGGRYAPQSAGGRGLLGHELTHVVQQAGTAGASPSATEASQHAAEQEAEDNARSLGSGEGIVLRGRSMPRLLQRRGEGKDPIHDPIIEEYRRRHGLPPGGRDEQGKSVGPSDADIKYKLAPAEEQARRRQPRSIQNFKRHRFGIFDAELVSDRGGGNPPCQLTATTRVKFNFPNTSGVWPQGRTATWQQEFIDLVQKKWSYRYLLVPASSCPDDVCQTVAVRVRIVPVQTGQHHTVNVLYNKSSSARSNVANPGGQGTFYEPDIRGQTALHETGHFFGVEHIRCDDNGWSCYGITAGQSDDLMGRGTFISARDYAPFVEVMRALTHCEWRTQSSHTRDVPSWALALGLTLGVGAAFLGVVLGLGLGGILGFGLLYGGLGAGLGWLIDTE